MHKPQNRMGGAMPNLNAAFNRFPYIEFRYHFEPKNSSTGIHEHAAISLGSGFGSGRDCPSSAYLSLSRNRAMKYMSLVWKGPFWVSLNAERATNSVSIPVSSLHSRTAAERMLSRGSTKPPVDKASTAHPHAHHLGATFYRHSRSLTSLQ